MPLLAPDVGLRELVPPPTDCRPRPLLATLAFSLGPGLTPALAAAGRPIGENEVFLAWATGGDVENGEPNVGVGVDVAPAKRFSTP